MMTQRSVHVYAWVSLCIRLILIAVSNVADRYFQVKYTDIDYLVYTDAAHFVYQRQSPFQRVTYRYSPILAWILGPCEWIPWFGKLLFSIADVICLFPLYYLIVNDRTRSKGDKTVDTARDARSLKYSSKILWGWTLSPLNVALCTRGSSDALSNLLTLLVLYFTQQNSRDYPQNDKPSVTPTHTQRSYLWMLIFGGALYGLSVHLRVYPVIYISAFLPHLLLRDQSPSAVTSTDDHADRHKFGSAYLSKSLTEGIHSCMRFVLGAALGFLCPTLLSVCLYGREYVDHAILYHLTRVDFKHNFSLHFYANYLTLSASHSSSHDHECNVETETCESIGSDTDRSYLSFLPFLPQMVVLLAIALKYAQKDLPLCLFLQTLAFVTFCKVVTAQYFSWYALFVPLLIAKHPSLIQEPIVIKAFALWMCSIIVWLGMAYLLEFQGANVFYYVWMASVGHFVANIILKCSIIRSVHIYHLVKKSKTN